MFKSWVVSGELRVYRGGCTAGIRGQAKTWEECIGSGWLVQVNRATFLLKEAEKTLQSPFKTKHEKSCCDKLSRES
jgi:hypothetical protein